MTQAEHDAIARILSDCDTAASAPNPAETPTTASVEAQPTDTPQYVPPPAEPTTEVGSLVYYLNCKSAKSAGAAPLYAGQPGYRPGLDRDGDGIACE